MTFALSARSRERLAGVHPHLVGVVERAIAISPLDFTVLEGLRTLERQRQLLASGATTTLNSRHLTGHAVDIAPLVGGAVSWDWAHYGPLSAAVKQAAHDVGVAIEWGGDWRTFKDGPHWQLPWATYPASGGSPALAPSGPAAPSPAEPSPAEPAAEGGGGVTPPRVDARTTSGLNIRTAPLPLGGEKIATLPAGSGVEIVETWSLVRTLVDGAVVEAWVADRYLDRS